MNSLNRIDSEHIGAAAGGAVGAVAGLIDPTEGIASTWGTLAIGAAYGAAVGAATDIVGQEADYFNKHQSLSFKCIDWENVGIAAAGGALGGSTAAAGGLALEEAGVGSEGLEGVFAALVKGLFSFPSDTVIPAFAELGKQ